MLLIDAQCMEWWTHSTELRKVQLLETEINNHSLIIPQTKLDVGVDVAVVDEETFNASDGAHTPMG